MLLQFTVENFRSFRDKTVFSMRAASNVERGADAPDVVKGTDIARCAALYGANASGKSNFIKALGFAREMVVHGVEERSQIRAQPFRLDPAAADAPSRFEFYLRALSGKTYGYGFVVRPDAVVHEWLSELHDGEEIELFSRDGNSFAFAPQDEIPVQELLNLVSSATPDNQLLLRTARQFKLKSFPQAFGDVLNWFELALVVIEPDAKYGPLVEHAHKDEAFRVFLGDVLTRADTGISGLRTVRRKVTKDERSALDGRAHYVNEGNDWYCVELRLQHGRGSGDESGDFELADESDGTVRLLDLSPMLFHARGGPRVFVVDELDRNLHTALSRWLIEHFIREAPGSESQLIFTTHDTNLLDVEVLRPDAYWFAEKDGAGASTLYSLAEFKAEQVAQLRKNLEQAYLVGRFGGVPRLREGS